jgi:putative nucleotidyltransferase with HDIG domain
VAKGSEPPLPPAVRAVVGAVGVAGAIVLGVSLLRLSHINVPVEWVLFSLLTFAAGLMMLKVPSVDAVFSISEVFAFSCLLLYGPEMGTVTVAVDALLLCVRRKFSRTQTIFNVGNLTFCVWVSGTLFFAVSGVPPLFQTPALPRVLLMPLGVMGVCYFLINSGLLATVVGAQKGRPPFAVWREHFLGLAPNYAAGASLALLLVVVYQLDIVAIALIPPILFISYLTLQSSFGRLEDSKRHVEKLNCMYLSTVETLATAIDAKDEVTHGHIRRVQGAAVGLARELGITDEETLKAIEAGGLLHDTGKIAVPEHILNKPGKLTPAEFEKMKLHAPIGAEILSSIDFPYPVVPIVRHHHENWDGTGYPDGLRGTDIPIGARILSVVDCFDALTSDRPYRGRMTNEASIAILLERRGTMYDPLIVDTFVATHERLMPAEAPMHPAARAVGGARSRGPLPGAAPAVAATDSSVSEEVLGVSSLARALAGEANLADAGALSWMMIKQVLPCASMGLFVRDERQDTVVGCYAAGSHAAVIRSLNASPGEGIVGWVAAHRRTAVNAEPALDFGLSVAGLQPPLLSALAVPLIHDGALVAVLSVYATSRGAFSEDHARLLDLLAPRLAASIAAVSGRDEAALDVPRAIGARSRTPSKTPADLTLLKGRRATG